MDAEKNALPVSKDDRDVDVSSSLGVFLPEGLQETPRLQLALGPAAHRVRGAHGTGGPGTSWRWERALGSHRRGLGAHPETMWPWLMQLN